MSENFNDWAKRMMEEYGPDSGGGDPSGDREPRKPKPKSGSDAEKVPEPEKEPVPVP